MSVSWGFFWASASKCHFAVKIFSSYFRKHQHHDQHRANISLTAERSNLPLLRPSESCAIFCWKPENCYSHWLFWTLLKFSIRVQIIPVCHLHLYLMFSFHSLTKLHLLSCWLAFLRTRALISINVNVGKEQWCKGMQRTAGEAHVSVKTWMAITLVVP